MMRPRWWNDHALLAAVAEHLHRKRAEGYPALVGAGTLSSDEAARGLRIMAAIAASWRAIADFAPEPDWVADADRGGAWRFERIETLTDAGAKARAVADAHPNDSEIVGLADAIDTLLWWETREPSARFLADCTIELRRRAAANRAQPLLNLGEAA